MTKKEKEKTYKERDVMVLLGSMDDGIKVVAESQQQSQKDIAELGKGQQGMQKDLDELRVGLKQGMADVKEELSEIKYTLRRKVDYEDFKKLEKRVLRLERARA